MSVESICCMTVFNILEVGGAAHECQQRSLHDCVQKFLAGLITWWVPTSHCMTVFNLTCILAAGLKLGVSTLYLISGPYWEVSK